MDCACLKGLCKLADAAGELSSLNTAQPLSYPSQTRGYMAIELLISAMNLFWRVVSFSATSCIYQKRPVQTQFEVGCGSAFMAPPPPMPFEGACLDSAHGKPTKKTRLAAGFTSAKQRVHYPERVVPPNRLGNPDFLLKKL